MLDAATSAARPFVSARCEGPHNADQSQVYSHVHSEKAFAGIADGPVLRKHDMAEDNRMAAKRVLFLLDFNNQLVVIF